MSILYAAPIVIYYKPFCHVSRSDSPNASNNANRKIKICDAITNHGTSVYNSAASTQHTQHIKRVIFLRPKS